MFNILIFLFAFVFALEPLLEETKKKAPREIVLTGTDPSIEEIVAMAVMKDKIRNTYGFVTAVNLLQYRLLID